MTQADIQFIHDMNYAVANGTHVSSIDIAYLATIISKLSKTLEGASKLATF